ncbi:hypothetical protein Lal_00037231 [Lupinus albus]|nr:hypothetical protein Lal_00037231 [Lupinus albus]
MGYAGLVRCPGDVGRAVEQDRRGGLVLGRHEGRHRCQRHGLDGGGRRAVGGVRAVALLLCQYHGTHQRDDAGLPYSGRAIAAAAVCGALHADDDRRIGRDDDADPLRNRHFAHHLRQRLCFHGQVVGRGFRDGGGGVAGVCDGGDGVVEGVGVLHNAPINLALFHARKDGIDVVQLVPGKVRRHLAFGREDQRLFQILACADDGAAHGDALQYRIEHRQADVARWQAHQCHGAACTQETERLFHRLGRHRRHQRPMRATDDALDFGHRIVVAAIDGQVGAQLLGQRQLVFVDVGRHHVHAHGLGVLHGHVAQAADAGNHHPLTRAHLGFLQALVDGHARAQHGGCRAEVQPVRQAADEVGIGQTIFGKAAVDRIAGVLLFGTQGFPAGAARRAATTGRMQPGHADTVAFLDVLHARAQRGDVARAFVAGNERGGGFDRPVAMGRVQVGMADAAGFELDQDLARTRRGDGHLFNRQGLAEFADDGRFHHLRHMHSSGGSTGCQGRSAALCCDGQLLFLPASVNILRVPYDDNR